MSPLHLPTPAERAASPQACADGPLDQVWYVAYGSNMQAARLHYYLAGGQPPNAARSYPGCRDHSLPRRSVPVMLPGGVYFALESKAWTGGMAFYDPALPGQAAARAYLVTAGQFADILSQEMYTLPGVQTDLAVAVEQGRVQLGPGRYETVVCAGHLDGYPLVTFTAPWQAAEVTWNAPSPVYLRIVANGLREAHGWDADRIATYLHGLGGVGDRWRLADLAAFVTARPRNGCPEQAPPTDRGGWTSGHSRA
jgi:hypothetical protein